MIAGTARRGTCGSGHGGSGFARAWVARRRCGGRMKVIAPIMDPQVVRKILTCIGLPARAPPLAPAREREQVELGFEA